MPHNGVMPHIYGGTNVIIYEIHGAEMILQHCEAQTATKQLVDGQIRFYFGSCLDINED